MAAAAPPAANHLDADVCVLGNGVRLTVRAVLANAPAPGNTVMLETLVATLSMAALLALPTPANPFAPGVPSPPIAGNAALANKAQVVADVVAKILALLAAWNPAWVPGFQPPAGAGGGAGGGGVGGGGGGGHDAAAVLAALAHAIGPKAEPLALELDGPVRDGHLAARVPPPQRDAAVN